MFLELLVCYMCYCRYHTVFFLWHGCKVVKSPKDEVVSKLYYQVKSFKKIKNHESQRQKWNDSVTVLCYKFHRSCEKAVSIFFYFKRQCAKKHKKKVALKYLSSLYLYKSDKRVLKKTLWHQVFCLCLFSLSFKDVNLSADQS